MNGARMQKAHKALADEAELRHSWLWLRRKVAKWNKGRNLGSVSGSCKETSPSLPHHLEMF